MELSKCTNDECVIYAFSTVSQGYFCEKVALGSLFLQKMNNIMRLSGVERRDAY